LGFVKCGDCLDSIGNLVDRDEWGWRTLGDQLGDRERLKRDYNF